MKPLVNTSLLSFIIFSVACSQNSGNGIMANQLGNQNQEVASNTNIDEGKIPRAIPIEDADVQVLANTMVGKPLDGQTPPLGVYRKWLSGGRGFYSPAKRKQYESFSEKFLTKARNETRTIYYPFGGPDVIYPLTFFPNTTTLILVGTEPIGVLPSLETAQSTEYQDSVNSMMETYLGSSFYRTSDMKGEAKSSEDRATWAKMMAAIALLDIKILSTETGTLSAEGAWLSDDLIAPEQRNSLSPKGVMFFCLRDVNGKSEYIRIYYFQQNLGESKYDSLLSLVSATPFQRFILSLNGNYTSFLKAASFLSHDTEAFKTSNAFVFGGNMIVQAPSGVPFSEFVKRRKSWDLTLFGEYREPSESFSNRHQFDLKEAYRGAIEKDRRAEYSDFVRYGGDLPFHYDYGTGSDGRAAGSMLFYGIKSKR